MENERQLADELVHAGVLEAILHVYRQFRPLNTGFQQTYTDWQPRAAQDGRPRITTPIPRMRHTGINHRSAATCRRKGTRTENKGKDHA